MVGRVAAFHRIEHALLVDVDQHPTIDCIPQARALHFARLQRHVAVAQDHGLAGSVEVADGLQRARIQPLGIGVVDQECRCRQQALRIHARAFDVVAVALQRAQIIDESEFGAQGLQGRPEALGTGDAEFSLEMLAQVGDHAIPIEQGVVDIEQVNNAGARARHRGLRHRRPRWVTGRTAGRGRAELSDAERGIDRERPRGKERPAGRRFATASSLPSKPCRRLCAGERSAVTCPRVRKAYAYVFRRVPRVPDEASAGRGRDSIS